MRDASKPVPPQPKQADLSDNRPPVLFLCTLFGAIMTAVYAVQEYDSRQRVKGMEASMPDTCLQEQWQQASAQAGSLPVIKDAKADPAPVTNGHTPKTCPEFIPPVS